MLTKEPQETRARLRLITLSSCTVLLLAASAAVLALVDRAWAETPGTPEPSIPQPPRASVETPRAPDAGIDQPLAGDPEVVRYEEGRLTLHADGASLARVLAAIAAETGAEIRGGLPTREVTVRLERVQLSEALGTLLRDHSFLLRYDRDGKLRAIELLGAGPPVTMLPSPARTSSPIALADEEAQAEILQRPVQVRGALARALGTETPSTGLLLHTAVGEERAAVRTDARAALLETFAANPEIEAAYLSTLQPVADATLAEILRASAGGEGAQELMIALASQARSAELRAKAAAVLEELRKTPP